MALERYRDLTPQHLHMAQRMVDGWGGCSKVELAQRLRKFAKNDRTDKFELAARLLHSALEYLGFALEVVNDGMVHRAE